MLVQPRGPSLIVREGVGMLVSLTIDLDRQARVLAVEIENVGPHRMLATEANAIQAPTSQRGPDEDFRQGQLAAELASLGDGWFGGVGHGRSSIQPAPSTA